MLHLRNRSQVFSLLTIFFCLTTSIAFAKKVVRYKIGIDSKPSGATVYVDGKKVGTSGPDFQVKLSRGSHTLKLDLGDDYKVFEDTLSVTADADQTYPLEPKLSKVDVVVTTSNPSAPNPFEVELFVNGKSKGPFVDMTQVQLPEGMYLLEVKKPSYKTFSERISITKPNQKGLSVFAKLDPEVKAPPVEVKPVEVKPVEVKPVEVKPKDPVLQVVIPATDQSALGAILYVDGAPAIQGLRTGDTVTVQPGRRRIEAIKEGYKPFGQQIAFALGEVNSVEITMTKIPDPSRVAATDPTVPAKVGDLLVIVDQPTAEVVVDATKKYKSGEIVQKLTPGQHSIQVTAPGYETYTEVVDIRAGEQTVKKVSLKFIDVKKTPRVRLVLNFPSEGNTVFYVNGKKYLEDQVVNDQGVEVPAGPTTIFVQKVGSGQFRTRFELPELPQRRDVVVELSNQGTLEVAADPAPVDIYIDKVKIASTSVASPLFDKELPVGEYLIEIRKPGGYQDFKQKVMIESGKNMKVYASLSKPDLAAVKLDPIETRLASTSFSAKTIEPGYWNLDIGGGYPYFADVRANAGILRRGSLGLDAGFEVRTFIYFTEAAANLRFQFVKALPFAMAANILIGGGFGPDGRNNVVFEAGLPLSLILSHRFTFTAHPYLQVYSDDPRVFADGTEAAVGRITDVRLILRGVFEIGLTHRVNLWLLFEGDPTRRDRVIYSNVYTKTMASSSDPFIYGRIGVTIKF